jgi:hypothetical protein
MTNDLFLAILAMDAYNRTGPRGTAVGLVVPDGPIGDATVLSGPGGVMEDPFFGFFAQAYDLGGQRIISYRGTDGLSDVGFVAIGGTADINPSDPSLPIYECTT